MVAFLRRILEYKYALAILFVFIAAATISYIKPCYQPRNMVMVLPTLLVGIVWGIFSFCKHHWVTLLVMFIGICWLLAVSIHEIYSEDVKQDWRGAVAEIAKDIKSGDTIMFYPGFIDVAWERYAGRREDITKIKIPRGSYPPNIELIKDTGTLWVVYANAIDSGRIHGALISKGFTSEITKFENIIVVRYKKETL